MKFIAKTSGLYYNPKEAERLTKLGVPFVVNEHQPHLPEAERMRLSEGPGTPFEINTLKELLDWIEKADREVIITKPNTKEEPWLLEIHDDYRE